MVFSLLARLLLRIDHKTALPRLNFYLHWLRILEFAASTAFLGIFLHFALGLPHGYDISNKMTVVYAMAIVTAVYPVLIWFLWLGLRKRRRVLYFRITRATDAVIVAPLLIALALVLGNAGLPTRCNELYIFDKHEYYLIGKRASTPAIQCNPVAAVNECGTGTRQIMEVRKVCRTARAGFSLVIITIVNIYIMISLVTVYLYFRPRDNVDPSTYQRHTRGPSFTNGGSESTQRLTMSQIDGTAAAHIANGETAPGEPPPPYTSRPSHGERVASADEVRRTALMTRLASEVTALSIPENASHRSSTGTADHPLFAMERTDSVLDGRNGSSSEPERRTVVQANPRLVMQPSREVLASRSASLREAGNAMSPVDVEAVAGLPFRIRAGSTSSDTSAGHPAPLPVAHLPMISGRSIGGPASPKQEVNNNNETSKLGEPRQSGHPGRGSWSYSITVMLDNVESSNLARGGSNASAPAAMN